MTAAEQIDSALRSIQVRGTADGNMTEATLVMLADLAVSVLRMIDARRESGVEFKRSYNEDELRRALESMANQRFPPGPPMRHLDYRDANNVEDRRIGHMPR